MAAEWRRRDLLRNLRETHDAESILELCNNILDTDGSDGGGALDPKEATLLISKLGKAGDVARALEVFRRGREAGTAAGDELRVKSALMHAFVRNGEFEQAKGVFLDLESNVAYPLDSVVVAAAATVAAELNDTDLLERAAKAIAADDIMIAPIEFEVARVRLAGVNDGPAAASAVVEEVLEAQRALGQKLKPADAVSVFQALVDAHAEAGDHSGVLNAAERMVEASQRPSEAAVVAAIDAAGALGNNPEANEALLRIFSAFRAGPRIPSEVYERLMKVLSGQDNHAGVCTVYDEVSSRRRPTETMDSMLQQSLRNLPRSQALELCGQFGIQMEV